MTELSPEETAALAAPEATAAARGTVAPRDFREPKSLSSEQLHLAQGLVTTSLQGIAASLASALRSFHKVYLASTSELSVEQRFDGLEAPFLVYQFKVGGELGWAIWDSAAAAAAVEMIVSGTSAAEAEARFLSRAEIAVLGSLMNRAVANVLEVLGLDYTPGTLTQDLDDLLTLRSAGPGADARRLKIHLCIEGALGSSDLCLYVPGVNAAPLPEREPLPTLPDHLDDIRLDLRAYLGSVDLSLSQLLALEIGDVIPLDVDSSDPLEIYVEERACAKGTWGEASGQLAVRLDQIDFHPGDIDCPNPS